MFAILLQVISVVYLSWYYDRREITWNGNDSMNNNSMNAFTMIKPYPMALLQLGKYHAPGIQLLKVRKHLNAGKCWIQQRKNQKLFIHNNIPPLNFWTKETSFSSSSQAFFDALAHFEKLWYSPLHL